MRPGVTIIEEARNEERLAARGEGGGRGGFWWGMRRERDNKIKRVEVSFFVFPLLYDTISISPPCRPSFSLPKVTVSCSQGQAAILHSLLERLEQRESKRTCQNLKRSFFPFFKNAFVDG
jgi:hypothetical protein